MKITRRKIVVLTGILIIIGGGLWGANLWVGSKIRSLLDQQVREGYLHYESVDVNIFSNRVDIKNPRWRDDQSKDIQMDRLLISDVSLVSYILRKELEIGHVHINNPTTILYQNRIDTVSQKQNSQKPAPIKSILIKNADLTNGTFQYFKQDQSKFSISCQLPRFEMENIRIDSATMKNSIPFSYGNYNLIADSVFYRMNELYHLKVSHMTAKNDYIQLDSLTIKSPHNKYQFQAYIPHEKAWVNLSIPRTEITNTDWLLNQDSIGFSASHVKVSDADLYLYKDNRLADNPYFKPLYSRLIRNLPIQLKVDSVEVANAAITFQLQTKKDPPPGNVYFREINANITHLSNVDMNHSQFPKTVISAQSRFMDNSKIHLDWSFDISNPQDDFLVSGTLSRIEAEGINYFIKPALNISADGAIDRLAFNFAGNNAIATGDMYINYDALRINLLKKDGTKRSRWISGILNFILRNKLNGPVEKKGLKIERVQTKSFWNFLWEMVKEGTLKTIV